MEQRFMIEFKDAITERDVEKLKRMMKQMDAKISILDKIWAEE